MDGEKESQRPHNFTVAELDNSGVEWDGNMNNISFKCKTCGQVWWPILKEGGKLPRGYWKCPNGCNC